MVSSIRNRYYEIEVKKNLEEKGYVVIRTQWEDNFFDIVALKGREVKLFRCKKNNFSTKEERKKLIEIRKKINHPIYFVFPKCSTKIFFSEIK
jgi:Holliday junction resolvase